MVKPTSIATVFIDTNILKFSVIKKHVYRRKKITINWGGTDLDTEYGEPYTVNELHRIKNEVLKRDAVFLGMLAHAGISELLSFYIHREVVLETWGLPGMANPSGRFYGCPIDEVPDPIGPQSRIVFGGNKISKEHIQDFVCSIKHPRYAELTKMTGRFRVNISRST